jgi:hypothetical protein
MRFKGRPLSARRTRHDGTVATEALPPTRWAGSRRLRLAIGNNAASAQMRAPCRARPVLIANDGIHAELAHPSGYHPMVAARNEKFPAFINAHRLR